MLIDHEDMVDVGCVVFFAWGQTVPEVRHSILPGKQGVRSRVSAVATVLFVTKHSSNKSCVSVFLFTLMRSNTNRKKYATGYQQGIAKMLSYRFYTMLKHT